MKFLFLSDSGDGMGLARRVADEGNEVSLWIRNHDNLSVGEGIVPKIHDWGFEVDRDTVVVVDCTGLGPIADLLRGYGCPVIGGSMLADRLEMDRAYAREVMQACGIQVPASKSFDDWKAAYRYIEKRGDARLVFKSGGALSGALPSYVSSSPDDLIEMMQHYERKFYGKPQFELQDFIEGTDISTEGWFDGTKFLRPFNHTLEQKHLMDGNLGPSGGCVGNLVWACDNEVCEETVAKLEGFLAENGYGAGPIDVNVVLNDDGVWGLEFTPRFGYDATPTMLWALYGGELGKLFSDVAHGQAESLELLSGYSAGIKLSVSPWPSEEHPAPEGLPLMGVDEPESFYPYQIMRNESGDLVTAGCQGIIGIALGRDEEPKKAFRRAYRVAKGIKVPDLQFRTDLAEEFSEDLEAIREVVEV